MKKIISILFIITISIVLSNIAYADEEYNTGDIVTYKEIEFYVINDSGSDYITVLKKNPLTMSEVNTYGGVGTDSNYVNKYTKSNFNTATNNYGYGGMAYYTSDTCGFVNGTFIHTGCTTDYLNSNIKHVVDSFSNTVFNEKDLAIDNLGYKSRLITIDELRNYLGYNESNNPTINTPAWVYDVSPDVNIYYTMADHDYYNDSVYCIGNQGYLMRVIIYGYDFGSSFPEFGLFTLVRPVVSIKKSALIEQEITINENNEDGNSKIDKTEDSKIDNYKDKNNVSDIVKVPDTMSRLSIFMIVLGIIIITISFLIRGKIILNKKD